MRKFITGLILLSLLTGCSDYKTATPRQKIFVDACFDILKSSVDNNTNSKGIKPDKSNKYDMLRMDKLAELTIALDETKIIVSTLKDNGKLHKKYIPYGDFNCPYDSITADYDKKYWDLKNEKASENLDAMNKEIDQALNGVIDEYKRKAVKHKIVSGSGPRVDVFVMKDGTIVSCKTTVTDAGKAVDCH